MLKNYSSENYPNYGEFEKALVDECVVSFIPHKAVYRESVVNIVSFTMADVDFNAKSRRVLKVMVELEPGKISTLIFNLAVNSGTLKLNEDDMCKYNSIKAIVDEAETVHEQEIEAAKKEAEELSKQKFLEAKQKAEEQAELIKAKLEEKKYQTKVAKSLKKLENLKPEDTAKLFNCPTTYYECLGWMAKHTTSVRAAMPDYMEKWFIGKFGDVDRYVVNSKKKTSGGFDYQWGLGLKISFDEAVSGILEQRATSQNKKVIDNVAFVWDLIENYGFQFGKTQDIEKIRSEVPKQYVSDFEKGLAM